MATTEADLITFSVDGREVTARPGEVVIAAAQRHGIYIPRFCWYPRMAPVGMCRQCLVEVTGPRGVTVEPACMLHPAPGISVATASPPAAKVQEGNIEYLLIHHPLDCPVCDRGGECPLQDHTLTWGPGESRFVEEKRHYAKPILINPLVELDRERCILCDRCVRFCREISGDRGISFTHRGNATQVLTFPGASFDSYFSGNTIQVCPVGALTAAPYRFVARPWDLDQVESTCTNCSVGCRILVQSSNNRVVRRLGVDADAINQGWLCDKGRFGYEAYDAEARFRHPLVRNEAGLEPAAWATALDRAATAIRRALDEHGPEAVAVIGGARLTNEDAYAWAKLAKGVIGTDHVDAQLGDGLPAEVVLGLPRATIDDACAADAVVLLGPDVKEELPVLYLRLRLAAIAGVSLVELTSRDTGLTPYAAATLRHRPGEAAELSRALADAAGGHPPAQPVAGVAAADIAAAGEILAGRRVVVALGRANLAETPAAVVAAAGQLSAALPGCRFLPLLRRGNVAGALDMGLAPGLLPGRVGLEAGREWYAAAWARLPERLGLDARGILGAAAAGRVAVLVLLGADPLGDFPDRRLARDALNRAGTVIAVDVLPNASTEWADVVLPAHAPGERAGTTTNLEGRVSRLVPKVVRAGTSRPDWMIAAELAWRLAADLGFESLDEIWAEIGRLVPSHAGLDPDLLAHPDHRQGVVVPLTPASLEPRPEGYPQEAAACGTAGNVAEVVLARTSAVPPDELSAWSPAMAGAPAHAAHRRAAEAAIEAATAPLPGAAAPPTLLGPPETPAGSEEASTAASPPPDGPGLRLVSGRTLYDRGVALSHSTAFGPLVPPARVVLHPADGAARGLASGWRARVRRSGDPAGHGLVLEVGLDAGLSPGAAWVTFNLEPGAAVLIDSGEPVTEVEVEPA